MKNLKSLFLLLLLIISLSACATTASSEAHNEKTQSHKKLLFEDWKYKGFGKELPVWFEAAYKGDVEKVKKTIANPNNYKFAILTSAGVNSDQAEKSLLEQLNAQSNMIADFDSSWVLLNEKEAAEKNNGYPYFAAAVVFILD